MDKYILSSRFYHALLKLEDDTINDAELLMRLAICYYLLNVKRIARVKINEMNRMRQYGYQENIFASVLYDLMNHRYEKAITTIDNIIHFKNIDPVFFFWKSVSLQEIGYLTQALGAVEEGLETSNEDAFLLTQKALILIDLQKYYLAKAELDKAIFYDNDFPLAYFVRSQVLFQLRRNIDAFKDIKKALDIHGDPYPIPYLMHYAIVLKSMDKVDMAIKKLELAYSYHFSVYYPLYKLKLELHFLKNELDNQPVNYRWLQDDISEVKRVILYQALHFKRNGDLQNAMQLLKEITLREPDSAIAHYMLGRLYHIQGKSEWAVENIEKAYKLNKDIERDYINFKEEISNKHKKQVDYYKQNYRSFLNEYYCCDYVLLNEEQNHGIVCLETAREDMIKLKNKTLLPDEIDYLYGRIETYLELGTVYFPDFYLAYGLRADYYILIHQYDNAIKELESVLKYYPNFPLAYRYLAELYAWVCDDDYFYKYFELALRFGYKPNHFRKKVMDKYKIQLRFENLVLKFGNQLQKI